MSGFDLPRQSHYANEVREAFAGDRITFLKAKAGFRRIDLHWCLTIEPSQMKALGRNPTENTIESSRLFFFLQKTAALLEGHLGSSIGLKQLSKDEAFQFFSYLFNLEEWAGQDPLRSDTGIDRQVVKSPIAWHSDHLQVGKRHVQMFSLKTTPEASRPCLFSNLLTLDCDSVLCTTWRVKSATAARSEIDSQEKFISFFKVGVLQRVMSGRDTTSLDTGAGAKAANKNVDDLSEVIHALDKKAHGEFSMRLLIAAHSPEQLREITPTVHRFFVDARAQVIEETLGNLSAFYAMFPGNQKFNVFPMWLAEDHHARLSSVFAPHIGHPHSEDLDNEYLNIFETRTRTPIFTYCALLSAIPITITLLVALYAMKPFLARSYTKDFIRATVGAKFNRYDLYGLIYLAGPKRKPRIVLPSDLVRGSMEIYGDKTISTSLSPTAKTLGYTTLFRGPEKQFRDEAFRRWLQTYIYGGDDLLASFEPALIGAGILVASLLCFAVPADFKRGKRMKYGRLLRGPEMHTPREFNSILKGDGMGIVTNEKGTVVRLPSRSEPKHIQVMGDTGVGKTTLLIQMLSQIEDRGDSAIIYDPAGEFIQRFYRAGRGDIVLNPLDARSPYWSPSSELKTPAEARTIAASLYQPTSDKKGEFFTETPQKVFAHLLKYRPTPQELVAWMSDESEIDRRVEGTELAAMIAKDAPDQRNGVLGSLGLIADALRLLPSEDSVQQNSWSATQWAETREGWIFLSSTNEAEQDALRPLHSLWIDLLILRLLAPAKEGQKRAWFVIDELATLQRLPQFHTALTKGRKSNNPIIFGYQGKAQLEVIYGHLAEVMLSQPATKIVMKTGEPKAAKWASELIGEVEIERVRETVADGKRAGKSFMMDRQVEPLVMGSEIEGLADLHAFLKLGNHVTRFSFPYMDRPKIAVDRVPRIIAEHDMWLNPLAPPLAEPAVARQVAAIGSVQNPPAGSLPRPTPVPPGSTASSPFSPPAASPFRVPLTDPSTDL